MKITLNVRSVSDYDLFLKVKCLPVYRFMGRTVEFPDEYAATLGMNANVAESSHYEPPEWMFDYQRYITAAAIRKQKYAAFVDCGLGKTAILLEFARHAAKNIGWGQCVLITSPLMVVAQTVAEAKRFYGEKMPIEIVSAANLRRWLIDGESRIGITNYEAITSDIVQGRLGALILDESSMLKSHYGAWGTRLLSLGKGLRWKLALTGTPAPNDRIEYANHAVLMDQFPTVNSFLARYFINRGQTGERWELKPHALRPFYRSLSHWSIFLTNPGTYGWKDNAGTIPPIITHIHPVSLTEQQRDLVFTETGTLFGSNAGGITSRTTLAQIAKGSHKGESVDTEKPSYIRRLVQSWPDESTIIWCKHNAEQDGLAALFPDAANITGSTPYAERVKLIAEFKSGSRKALISKPKILGFGLNLQIATRQIFSGLQDSYEEYYQAVKRSNRVGSTRPLNVHIPITEIERPMIETVLEKAARVQADANEQERMFKNAAV